MSQWRQTRRQERHIRSSTTWKWDLVGLSSSNAQNKTHLATAFITGTNETVEWSTGRTERVLYHRMVRSTPVAQDVNEYAENASIYLATELLNPEVSVR